MNEGKSKSLVEADDSKRPILNAALRGARFGGIVAAVIMGIVGLLSVGLCIIVGLPAINVCYEFCGLPVAVGLSAAYGAIIGAAIMGVFALFRLRR